MGSGVSADQGNLPAHGKRDVREGFGARRHDWFELARTREIVTSPPKQTAYSYKQILFQFQFLADLTVTPYDQLLAS